MDIDKPAMVDIIFNDLKQDLNKVLPSYRNDDRIICCMCGRLLRKDQFSLEHIIPQQALKKDIRDSKSIPKNTRAGLTLLCKQPLKLRGKKVSELGCNAWKGKHYDKKIASFLQNQNFNKMDVSNIISIFSTCFIAMFSVFGYKAVFTHDGIICRRQFFSPDKFRRDIPEFSQIILAGSSPEKLTVDNQKYWSSPFYFFEKLCGNKLFCSVSIRHVAMVLPLTQSFSLNIRPVLPWMPSHRIMRPDFTPLFS
ncbi:MAG: hypothetical protein JJK57_15740 [Komagataeibacter hansenii]|nr:hypothetical protein [Novacetimonas hansenii]